MIISSVVAILVIAQIGATTRICHCRKTDISEPSSIFIKILAFSCKFLPVFIKDIYIYKNNSHISEFIAG